MGRRIVFLFVCIFLFGLNSFAFEDLRVETWINNLNNDNPLIRKSSARFLGQLGDKGSIPYLVKALKDTQAEVRAEVCNTLGLLGDESVKPVLEEVMYKDSSPMVRYNAKKALDNIDTYIGLQKEKKLKELKEKLKQEGKSGTG